MKNLETARNSIKVKPSTQSTNIRPYDVNQTLWALYRRQNNVLYWEWQGWGGGMIFAMIYFISFFCAATTSTWYWWWCMGLWCFFFPLPYHTQLPQHNFPGVAGDGLTGQMDVWMSKNGGYDWTEVSENYLSSLLMFWFEYVCINITGAQINSSFQAWSMSFGVRGSMVRIVASCTLSVDFLYWLFPCNGSEISRNPFNYFF